MGMLLGLAYSIKGDRDQIAILDLSGNRK